jgi:hypothetical protein
VRLSGFKGDLILSQRRWRMSPRCAFPPFAAAPSALLEALQSGSLALDSPPRNVMRGGFRRSEALILSVFSKEARDKAYEGWLRITEESP